MRSPPKGKPARGDSRAGYRATRGGMSLCGALLLAAQILALMDATRSVTVWVNAVALGVTVLNLIVMWNEE